MRQQKKSQVRILRKKLAEIDSGKWRASDEDKKKLRKALANAEFAEGERGKKPVK